MDGRTDGRRQGRQRVDVVNVPWEVQRHQRSEVPQPRGSPNLHPPNPTRGHPRFQRGAGSLGTRGEVPKAGGPKLCGVGRFRGRIHPPQRTAEAWQGELGRVPPVWPPPARPLRLHRPQEGVPPAGARPKQQRCSSPASALPPPPPQPLPSPTSAPSSQPSLPPPPAPPSSSQFPARETSMDKAGLTLP